MTTLKTCTLLLGLCLCLLACKTAIPETTIHDLKANGIAFRLHDYEGKKAALRKAGLQQEADDLEREMKIYNQAVIRFFQDEFDFCPVYFFYASQQDALKQGKPVLLNEQLQPAPGKSIPQKLFIADYLPYGYEASEARVQEKFYVEGTIVQVRPVYRFLRWKNMDKMLPKDVAKFNRVLHSGRVSKPK